jgi:threonine dehydratase
VSDKADAYAKSVEANRIIATETANTFADGMACRIPMQAPLDIIANGISHIVRVSDDQIADAMRHYYTDTHNIAESAGAAALAAAIIDKPKLKHKKVGLILSGGNVDKSWFKTVLNGNTPMI